MNYSLLVIGLLLAGRPARAQQTTPPPHPLPVDSLTHQITYAGNMAVPGATQNELYARGSIWFGTAFLSAQAVLQSASQPAGLLVGRGFSDTTLRSGFLAMPSPLQVWCTITLACQSGQIHYTLTDFVFAYEQASSRHHFVWRSYAAQVVLAQQQGISPRKAHKFSCVLDQEAQRLVTSLQAGMRQDTAGGAW